jgi:hypothetical protein
MITGLVLGSLAACGAGAVAGGLPTRPSIRLGAGAVMGAVAMEAVFFACWWIGAP